MRRCIEVNFEVQSTKTVCGTVNPLLFQRCNIPHLIVHINDLSSSVAIKFTHVRGRRDVHVQRIFESNILCEHYMLNCSEMAASMIKKCSKNSDSFLSIYF